MEHTPEAAPDSRGDTPDASDAPLTFHRLISALESHGVPPEGIAAACTLRRMFDEIRGDSPIDPERLERMMITTGQVITAKYARPATQPLLGIARETSTTSPNLPTLSEPVTPVTQPEPVAQPEPPQPSTPNPRPAHRAPSASEKPRTVRQPELSQPVRIRVSGHDIPLIMQAHASHFAGPLAAVHRLVREVGPTRSIAIDAQTLDRMVPPTLRSSDAVASRRALIDAYRARVRAVFGLPTRFNIEITE